MDTIFADVIHNESWDDLCDSYCRASVGEPSFDRYANSIIKIHAAKIPIPALSRLITIVALRNTPQQLLDLIQVIDNEIVSFDEEFICEYIRECYHDKYLAFREDKFKILWRIIARNELIKSGGLYTILCNILIRIRQNVRNNRLIFDPYIAFAQIIFADVNPGHQMESDGHNIDMVREVLLRIACYDISRVFCKNLQSAGYLISGFTPAVQTDIIMEFTYIPKSLFWAIELVEWLLDQNIDIGQLYPLYSLAFTQSRIKYPILQYLIDIGIKIPISPEDFLQMVGEDCNPEMMGMQLLRDAFEAKTDINDAR